MDREQLRFYIVVIDMNEYITDVRCPGFARAMLAFVHACLENMSLTEISLNISTHFLYDYV